MRKNILILMQTVLFFCAVALCGCAKCEEHVYSKPCDFDCNVCGEERTLPDDVEHRVKTWKSNGDYTCETDGTKSGACMFCYKSVTAVDEGSATGHVYYDEDVNWRLNSDNTHTEDGTESQLCYFCNKPGEKRVAVGSAGHNFGTTDILKIFSEGYCKECGWKEPILQYTNIYEFESFEPYKEGYSFKGLQYDRYAKLCLKPWTQKEGVNYTVVGIDRGDYTNIRALKVEREAVSVEANNDAIVDLVPIDGRGTIFPSDAVWQLDLMIGEGNQADIYLSTRKEIEGKAYYNIFLWYCAETKQILVGDTVIADNIVAGEWHTVALVIDDESKIYDLYLDGECVLQDVEYLNSVYPTAIEQSTEFYRITAMKGTEAVEFYLDNVKLSNSTEYVGG